jgi:hypothetical protein
LQFLFNNSHPASDRAFCLYEYWSGPDLFELFLAQTEQKDAPRLTSLRNIFRMIIRKYKIRQPATNTHDTCPVCAELRARVKLSVPDAAVKLEKHLTLVRQERVFMYFRSNFSLQHPQLEIVVFEDCAASLHLPHFYPNVYNFESRQIVEVIGVSVIGWKRFLFFGLPRPWKKGANMICTLLFLVLRALKTEAGPASRTLAPELRLWTDAAKQNLSTTMLYMLGALVSECWYSSIHFQQLPVYHTKNMQDQACFVHFAVLLLMRCDGPARCFGHCAATWSTATSAPCRALLVTWRKHSLDR